MKHSRLALIFLSAALVGSAALAASAPVTMLQFGSFETKDEAEKRLSEVKSKHGALISGLATSVRELKLPPDNLTVYRTQAGPLAEAAAARDICAKLAAAGDECYTVKTMMADVPAPAQPMAAAASTRDPAAPVEAKAEPKFEAKPEIAAPEPAAKEPVKEEAVAGPETVEKTESAALVPAPPSPDMQRALDEAAVRQDAVAADLAGAVAVTEEKRPQSFWSRVNPFSDDASQASGAMKSEAASAAAIAPAAEAPVPPAPVMEKTEKPVEKMEEREKAEKASPKPAMTVEKPAPVTAPALAARPALSPVPVLPPPPIVPPAMAHEVAHLSMTPAAPPEILPPMVASAPPPPAMVEQKKSEPKQVEVPPAPLPRAASAPSSASTKPVPALPAAAIRPEKPVMLAKPAPLVAAHLPPPPSLPPLPPETKIASVLPLPTPPPAPEPIAAIAPMPTPVALPAAPAPVAMEAPVLPPPPVQLAYAPERMILPPPPEPLNAQSIPNAAPMPPVALPSLAPIAGGEVNVGEATRVPVTQTPAPVIQQAPLLPPPPVVVARPGVPLQPSSTTGQKTVWAQIGPFPDGPSALDFWANYRQTHPDFPVVRVRVTSPYQQQLRGKNENWLRVGPMGKGGFVSNLCNSLGEESGVRCGMIKDLGVAASADGNKPGSRYTR